MQFINYDLQCFRSHRICDLCDLREADSSEHILFRCEALSISRHNKLTEMYSIMPNGMVSSISDMTDTDKLLFLLSGLRCNTLIEEWIPILLSISSFVYTLYEERKKLYENINSPQLKMPMKLWIHDSDARRTDIHLTRTLTDGYRSDCGPWIYSFQVFK